MTPQEKKLFDAVKEKDINKVKAAIDEINQINSVLAENPLLKETLGLFPSNVDAIDGNVTALGLATSTNQDKIIHLLFKAGANIERIDLTGHTPLMIAANNGQVKSLEALIGLGANIEAHDSSTGDTALILAAYRGHLKCVASLLNAGADRNATDNGGKKAFDWAKPDCKDLLLSNPYLTNESIYKPEKKLFDSILDKKLSLPNRKKMFNQALNEIKQSQKMIISDDKLKLTIRLPSINVQTVSGFTPLMLAVQHNLVPFALLLIAEGADLNVKTNFGFPVCSMLRKTTHSKISEAIKNPSCARQLLEDIEPMTPLVKSTSSEIESKKQESREYKSSSQKMTLTQSFFSRLGFKRKQSGYNNFSNDNGVSSRSFNSPS